MMCSAPCFFYLTVVGLTLTGIVLVFESFHKKKPSQYAVHIVVASFHADAVNAKSKYLRRSSFDFETDQFYDIL